MLKVDNISFSYGKNLPNVLNNISFEINPGDILTVIGANGAGKSTLMGCIISELKPSTGNITINGEDISKMSLKQLARNIGYVRQDILNSVMFSVRQYVCMGFAPHLSAFKKPGAEHIAKAEELLEKIGLKYLADKPMNAISGGERQQVAIARALVQSPKVILFDEPTSHLDLGNQIKITEIISELSRMGYAIIMTTHDPAQALLIDDMVGVIEKDGSMIIGKASEMITGELLSRVYGTKITIVDVPDTKIKTYAVVPENKRRFKE